MKSIIYATIAGLLLTASVAKAQSLSWTYDFTDVAVDSPMWSLQSENYVPVGHSDPESASFSMSTGVGGHGTDIVTGGETAGG